MLSLTVAQPVLYRTAAEAGVAHAQSKLGLMYARGRGIAQDDVQAVHCGARRPSRASK